MGVSSGEYSGPGRVGFRATFGISAGGVSNKASRSFVFNALNRCVF